MAAANFHRVHGENIRVTDNGKKASRVESFNKALCFTDRPLRVDERLIVRIAQASRSWSGTLRIGVTIHDPVTFQGRLPKYCCPDLNAQPGNWGKAIEERDAKQDCVLQVYYTSAGHVMIQGADGRQDVFLSSVPTNVPLYVVFDVYGNTQGIELLDALPASQVAAAAPVQQPAPVAPQQPAAAPQQATNSATRNRCAQFGNVDVRPAQLANINSAHVQAAGTVAIGLTGRMGGLAFVETAIGAGETLIVQFRELHRPEDVLMAVSAATPAEIRSYANLDGLCDNTYSVPVQSGPLPTGGQLLALLISPDGVMYVARRPSSEGGLVAAGGAGWQRCVHLDPSVTFRVVFDMQHVKELSLVGITAELNAADAVPQAAANASPKSADSTPAATSSAAGPSSTAAAAAPPPGSKDSHNGTDCVVCLDNPRNMLIDPCYHLVLCETCAKSLMTTAQKQCPICRREMNRVQRVFMT